MSRKIFISYRREDSKYQARILHAALRAVLPPENVFMDVDSIPPGVNFRRILKEWVDQCDTLLALIGPGWLGAAEAKAGRRRLDNPADFVRIEIGEALARDIPVVPVLLDGTPMPSADELPDDLRELAYRQALFLEYRTFDTDVERLIRKLELSAGPRVVAASSRTLDGVTPDGDASNSTIRPEAYLAAEWNNRGVGLHNERKFAKAIECFDKALLCNPDYAIALANRGASRAAMRDAEAAMRDFDASVSLAPDAVSGYLHRAKALAARGLYVEAAADMTRLIELEPSNWSHHNSRAWYRFKMSELAPALEDVERSLQLKPDNAYALDTRAHILEAMGEDAKALADFERALALDPDIDESRQGVERLSRLR